MLILDNPYFSRTWTIQELVVGVLQKTVVVTHAGQVQWAHMLALAAHHLTVSVSSTRDERNMRVHRRLSCRGAFSHIKPSLDGSQPGLRLAPMWSSETSHYPFENISSLSASEPRDKAYGFLWALPRSRELGLDIFKVDYTKSVETIFTEFTVSVAHETGDILPLLYMSCQKFKMSTLSSWVPDWTIGPRFEEWNFWRRLGSGDSKGMLKQKNARFRFRSERIAFTDSAMVVSGFSQTDRISQREILPFLSGDKGAGLETVFLHHYDPRVFEKLIVGVYNLFKMLDGVEDIIKLAVLYVDPSKPLVTENDETTPPKDRCNSEAIAFLIMRGIVCTYMQAKKSDNHCDVDRDKWQSGIRSELAGLFTEDFLEKTVLMIPELGGPDTENPWGVGNHMVSELISWMMVQAKINVFWPLAEIAGGEIGAVIFKTESGRFGLAQANVEIGDEMVQWEGASCPVIVRRLVEEVHDYLPEGFHCRLVSIAKASGTGHADSNRWEDKDLTKYIVV
ncbi:hypothetical protein NW762_012190 [Fusarium torreyae]|uniref:Heterokaryon incompatibility domain-containing protein n=1 Tax=Fusarium torreyae TaxID=1237075 RepID=A0A9W8RPP0_9HYPO|nr:hypothetical protein NW762_012190 [Fusarium torreyae]